MCKPSKCVLEPALPIKVERTGRASFLLALLRPGEAKAATVDAYVLTLALRFGAKTIPIQDIRSVGVARGWFWSGTQIRHAFGREAVSGLSRDKAQALVDALKVARLDWWRNAYAAQRETLRFVHDRLAQPRGSAQIHGLQRFFSTSSELPRRRSKSFRPNGPRTCTALQKFEC